MIQSVGVSVQHRHNAADEGEVDDSVASHPPLLSLLQVGVSVCVCVYVGGWVGGWGLVCYGCVFVYVCVCACMCGWGLACMCVCVYL